MDNGMIEGIVQNAKTAFEYLRFIGKQLDLIQ